MSELIEDDQEGPIRPMPWDEEGEPVTEEIPPPTTRIEDDPSWGDPRECTTCGEMRGSKACQKSRWHFRCTECHQEPVFCRCGPQDHSDERVGLRNRYLRDPDRRRIKRMRSH